MEDIKNTEVEAPVAAPVKKSEGQRILEAFLPPGGLDGAKDRIIFDTIIPTIKKIMSDTVDTILYGSAGSGRKPSGNGGPQKQYDGYFGRREAEKENARLRPQETSSISRTSRDIRSYQYEDVTVVTRGQALNIIACMKDIVREYECVTVADLYDMAGVPQEYTDQNFGWLNVESAQAVPLRTGGYSIRLPYPVQLPRAIKVR